MLFFFAKTGGSEWIKEDVIHLKNIEMHAELPPMDLSVFNNGTTSQNSKAQVKIAVHILLFREIRFLKNEIC